MRFETHSVRAKPLTTLCCVSVLHPPGDHLPLPSFSAIALLRYHELIAK